MTHRKVAQIPTLSRTWAALLAIFAAFSLAGCAVNSPDSEASGASETTSGAPRIVATSAAVAQICEALDLDLVGVPETTTDSVPERYADVTTIGLPMSVDMEILASLEPDYVLSPTTLEEDLSSQYEAAGLNGYFLDLTSIEGLYESIDWMAEEFGKTAEAEQLHAEYDEFMADFETKVGDAEAPNVLILMGVPGSYLVATENSYVGNLVELVGGVNIYAGTDDQFLNANTEDMLAHDPDVILRSAHGLPEVVTEMFAEEFAENDIWSHFTAVQEGRVYDLPYDEFGMSAKLNYIDALEYLVPLLYE